MSSNVSTSHRKPPKVKQACDCCHARKIRCDGNNPCNNCQTTNLQCTYLLVPKKKGPKGPSSRMPRAVLKMRLNQEQSISPENGSKSASSTLANGSINEAFEPSPLLTEGVVEKFIDSFFTHKYPVMPILRPENLVSWRTSPNVYSLVASLCAAVASQVQGDASSPILPPSDPPLSTEFFINESKRARAAQPNYTERPVLNAAQANFFLFAALFNLDRHNSAWFHLREAMTILQLLRLHEEDTYLTVKDEAEALFSRRTFWLFFVTERAYALQRHRPLTLQRTINLPLSSPEDSDSVIISGFLDLVSLFQNFDDNFVRLWNTSSQTPAPAFPPDTASASASQLEALQATLAMLIPDVSQRTEIQQADLLVSRQWLKTMVWQLCVTKRLLTSTSPEESMRFDYPIIIARDVVVVGRTLRREAFEPHGPGILEKIFDIGCSLADVLELYSASPQAIAVSMQVGPRDYLMQMLQILSTVLGGSSRYLSMLAQRADECLHVNPRPALESSCGKVIEVCDEEMLDQSGVEDSGSSYGMSASTDNRMSEFGSLSDTSFAWLESMSEDSFTTDVDVGGSHEGLMYQQDIKSKADATGLHGLSMAMATKI